MHSYVIPFNIEKIINDNDYANRCFLKIKKDIHYSDLNLHTIKYRKDKLNEENIHSLGLFRSVITKNNKIVCFSPPKSHKYENLKKGPIPEIFTFEDYVEGTMINTFYLPEKNIWELSTRSCITADCIFSTDSVKTFRDMWHEALQSCNIPENMELNKKYCYSFILQHPENRIVVRFEKPNIVLIAIYKIEEDVITSLDINSNEFEELRRHFSTPIKFKHKSTWEENHKHFSDQSFENVGVVIKNKKTGERTKIRNKNYEKIRQLKGNSPKIQFQYYTLRRLRKIQEFLKYYPEHKQEFDRLRSELYNWTEQLYQNYISCFIKKERKCKEYPFPFRIHMYNLHKIYLENLKGNRGKISKRIVIDHINNIEPAALMFLLNFKDSHMKCEISN